MDTPTFSTAAVAAPHRLAALSGRNVLAAGGNAIEAMVAMAAAIAVLHPHANGLGGDGFWLVREPGGRVLAIEACGPAGVLATRARYRALGHGAIPLRGPDAALTVAGTVGGWALALDYAKSLGGRMGLSDLLADAVRFARDGVEISAAELGAWRGDEGELSEAPGFAATFASGGKPPEAGDMRRNPKLADTLSYLAAAGLDDFYRGDVGREVGADIERLGMPVTRADYSNYRARVREPLVMRLREASLYGVAPPSQGLAALLIQGIHERLGIEAREDVRWQHGLIEAAKRAYRIRDVVITDPRELKHDPVSFLTPERFEREAAAIDMRRAAPFASSVSRGDAIWMGAIDASGLAVSFAQSIGGHWGSGCVLPATGILLQNRGASFSLDPAAANTLEPSRLPFCMLSPALAAFDDERVMSYGAADGDGQPQVQAQLFARYADLGQGVGAAVEAPAWLLGRADGAISTRLDVGEGFDPEIADGLARLGHEVEIVSGPVSNGLGHAGMLVKRSRDGRVEAMHGSRQDGGVEGL